MGLSWQQGPLGRNPSGRFLVPGLPERLLYAEPLRRRLRAELGGVTVVTSDDAVLLFEPGRYPVAYFPRADFLPGALVAIEHRSAHPDLGETGWLEVVGGTRNAPRGAWEHVALPPHAAILEGKVALAWRGMDGFYEEDERILGHAADPYHRIDLRRSSRSLLVRAGGKAHRFDGFVLGGARQKLPQFARGLLMRQHRRNLFEHRIRIAANSLRGVEQKTGPQQALTPIFEPSGQAQGHKPQKQKVALALPDGERRHSLAVGQKDAGLLVGHLRGGCLAQGLVELDPGSDQMADLFVPRLRDRQAAVSAIAVEAQPAGRREEVFAHAHTTGERPPSTLVAVPVM